MKKYLKMIPVMFYPYAYVIPLIIRIAADDSNYLEEILLGILICGIVFNILVIIVAFYNSVVSACGKYSVVEAAKINMITKCVQIPAYIFHFWLGILGLIMSIWGIGIILFVVVVDLITIFITGGSAMGLSVLMLKTKTIDFKFAVLGAIASFMYCIDVVVAIKYYWIAKNKIKNNCSIISNMS